MNKINKENEMGWWWRRELSCEEWASKLMQKWLTWFDGDAEQAKRYAIISLSIKEVNADATDTLRIKDCLEVLLSKY
jgi:hypothetical protein